MKKIFVLSLLSLALLPTIVLADYGEMMENNNIDGMMNFGNSWTGSLSMIFLGAVYFAVFSFIFSLIFWFVYNKIAKK